MKKLIIASLLLGATVVMANDTASVHFNISVHHGYDLTPPAQCDISFNGPDVNECSGGADFASCTLHFCSNAPLTLTYSTEHTAELCYAEHYLQSNGGATNGNYDYAATTYNMVMDTGVDPEEIIGITSFTGSEVNDAVVGSTTINVHTGSFDMGIAGHYEFQNDDDAGDYCADLVVTLTVAVDEIVWASDCCN